MDPETIDCGKGMRHQRNVYTLSLYTIEIKQILFV